MADDATLAPSVQRQTLILVTGRATAALLSALWLAVAARRLPVADFADLVLLLSLMAVASVIADLGISLRLSALVAATRRIDRHALTQAIRVRLAASAVAATLVLLAYRSASHNGAMIVPLFAGVSILATSVYSSITAACRGLGSVMPEAASEAVSRTAVVVVGAAALAQTGTVTIAAAVYAAVDVATAACLALWSRKRIDASPSAPAELAWRTVLPIGVASITAAVYGRLNIWLLAVIGTPESVAHFGAAHRLYEAALLPATAVSAITAPELQRRREPWRTFVHLMLIAAATVAPLAAVLFAVSPSALLILFGDGFDAGVLALRVLLVSAVPGVAVAVAAPLILNARSGWFLRALFVGLSVNATIGAALIRARGAEGAALSALASQLVLAVVLVRLVRRLRMA